MALSARYLADKSALARMSHPAVGKRLGPLVESGLVATCSVALPDLMIAATAERHGLVVLHYDADFDHVAAVSGQETDWVVERGSVP